MNKEENYWNLSNQAAQIMKKLKWVDRIFRITFAMVGCYFIISFPLQISHVILLLIVVAFFLYRMKVKNDTRDSLMRIIQIYNTQIDLLKGEGAVSSEEEMKELTLLKKKKFQVVKLFQELIWLSLGSSEFRNSNFIATFFC